MAGPLHNKMPPTPDQATPAGSLKKKSRTWSAPLAVLGLILAYACMLAAKGNGWSPLVWIAIGLLGTPFLAWILRRCMNPWLGRLIALATVCALSFVLARISTRINPAEAYAAVLGAAPSPTVTLIDARKQWYDGINYVVAFNATRSGIDDMLTRKKFEDESDHDQNMVRRLAIVPFLDMTKLMPRSFTSTNSWECIVQKSSGDVTWTRILWNQSTGRGVLIG
jgi:hypothetical protein